MHQPRSFCRIAFCIGLFCVCVAAESTLWAQNFDAEKLRIASAQHEIIQILIREKQFEQIPGELAKILDLQLSPPFESKIIRSILISTNQLVQQERSDIALRMLEQGIQSLKLKASKSELFQEMGYIYRLLGNNLKAMECFRRAQQLASGLSTR